MADVVTRLLKKTDWLGKVRHARNKGRRGPKLDACVIS